MDFGYDETTLELRERLQAFMDELVYPAEAVFEEQVRAAASPWDTPPVIEELKVEARRRGLWNLFLPATHAYGAGLTNLQYAPLAEITGRSRLDGARGAQLLGAGHRQHGAAVRCSGPPSRSAAGSSRCSTADPLGVLDDRAGRSRRRMRPTSRRASSATATTT